MRVFFALEVPAETALAIAQWRERQLPAAGRPVPAANFHITLAFLGEVDQRGLDSLCRSVSDRQWQVDADSPITLDQVGYWPKPGICWLGPGTIPSSLAGLARALQSLSQRAGARRERKRYQPHVTLFRRCERPPPAPARAANFCLEVRDFCLFESRPARNGVTYSPLQQWQLSRP